jgi:Fur family transcriptional regulator, ferric uptake regulator
MLLEWLDKIRNAGYRLTGPRKIIIEIIAESGQVLSPYEIYTAGRKRFPGLGLVTVYRTLEKLEQLNLIQRVHQPDGCHRILPATHGHQHILLCTTCGKAEYFSGDDLGILFANLSSRSGYQIQDHILQLLGICAKCQADGVVSR